MVTKIDIIKDLIELRERISEDLEKLDSIIETLEIISDEELIESIKRGLEDIEKGNVVDFEEIIDVYLCRAVLSINDNIIKTYSSQDRRVHS